MRSSPAVFSFFRHLSRSLLCLVALALAGLALGGARADEADGKPALRPQPPPRTSLAKRPPNEERIRPRGLWVLCEGSQRVLEDVSRIDELIRVAVQVGATDLFVQVYRGGKAWYRSEVVDDAPYAAILAGTGLDSLSHLIERAHAVGIRVHAWVNVLSLSGNREARILRELGAGAVLVDRKGRSLLDYPQMELPSPDRGWYRMGTRGIYLDPAAPGVSEKLVSTFEELLGHYPELDGLHLDYIRHPGVLPFSPGSRFGVGLDFGYGLSSRERFQQETGLGGPYRDSDPGSLVNPHEWDAWRREKVTALVASIARTARSTRPGVLISAAVNSYVDRAYLTLAQDWPRWLEEGLIDLAIPMTYTLDDRLLRYQLQNFSNGPGRERIWSGLGVWLFSDEPERALKQLAISRRAGIAGDVLFSYDSMMDSPTLISALSKAATPSPDEDVGVTSRGTTAP